MKTIHRTIKLKERKLGLPVNNLRQMDRITLKMQGKISALNIFKTIKTQSSNRTEFNV